MIVGVCGFAVLCCWSSQLFAGGSAGRGSNWSDGSPLPHVCSMSRVILFIFILLSATAFYGYTFFYRILTFYFCRVPFLFFKKELLLFVTSGPLFIGVGTILLTFTPGYMFKGSWRAIYSLYFVLTNLKIYSKRGVKKEPIFFVKFIDCSKRPTSVWLFFYWTFCSASICTCASAPCRRILFLRY